MRQELRQAVVRHKLPGQEVQPELRGHEARQCVAAAAAAAAALAGGGRRRKWHKVRHELPGPEVWHTLPGLKVRHKLPRQEVPGHGLPQQEPPGQVERHKLSGLEVGGWRQALCGWPSRQRGSVRLWGAGEGGAGPQGGRERAESAVAAFFTSCLPS